MKGKKFCAAGLLTALLAFLMTCTVFAGAWQRDGNGWWYLKDDGSYPKNVMTYIDGEWYAFDGYGYMKSNEWVMADGQWYYFTGNGEMAHDTWIQGTYYVGSDGIMLTNTWTPDGYWVNELGAWDPSKTQTSTKHGSEYFTIDGSWDNRDQNGYSGDRRVDLTVTLMAGEEYFGKMDFGLYMSSGTPYSLYDSQNPNGDSISIATVDGLNWGGRSQISGDWYDLVYNGKDTITLYWRKTAWNYQNSTLVFKRRSGGTLMPNWTDGSSYSSNGRSELETADIHGVG